ncbi:MAG: 6-phosphogluconolactonase [Actinomycetota bacterium]|nr:6-phosphogluconolactonase [Actinomycetota bacterium]
MSLPPLSLVEDVPSAFAALAHAALRRQRTPRFRLAFSGGSAGRACLEALVATEFDWSRVDFFLVDERCVPPDHPDSNARSLAEALAETRLRLFGFHPMSCTTGPEAYAAEIAAAGGAFELIQLGLGPDGHTASLFAHSPALEAPAEVLVARNEDPSGNNAHPRLTLTYGAISRGALVVMTAFGAAKHDVLVALHEGADLPAAHVKAPERLLLVDREAAGDLPTVPLAVPFAD